MWGAVMQPVVKHQTQPCAVSCVSTCIAMIAGKSAQDVKASIHEDYRAGKLSMRQMLRMFHISFQSFDSCEDRSLVDEGVYLVCAPSLNIEAGNHQILVEVTDENYFVIDPVKGRAERKYYVRRGDAEADPLAVELGGFVIDAFIPRKWLEARNGV